MREFYIRNNLTKDSNWTKANTFTEACQNLGWHPFDCFDMTVNENPKKIKTLVKVKMPGVPDGYFLKAIYFKENGSVSFQYWSPFERERRLDVLMEQAKRRKRDSNGRFKKEKLIF